ncbi:hypothetical protein BJV78DRAFT_1132076 [Lactifluus subvellereus]|nr:hypothetical protein BJV78DRAFT_1132076 [Lactifluus subvellereus]
MPTDYTLRSNQTKLYCLFSLLILPCITCLVLSLFLLSYTPGVRKIVTSAWGIPPANNSLIVTHVGSPSRNSFRWNPGESYLAYLPHSGFHNQRIALENALVLARILNRTLLIPPARLGNDLISYHKFDDLYSLLIHSGKQGSLHCSKLALDVSPPSECWDYFDYTFVSWDWLVDLSTVAAEQSIFHHELFTYPWLENPPRDTDTLRVKDQTAYDFRFVDYTPGLDVAPHPRYLVSYPISTLAASSAQLVQLGTLFGSARLHLTDRGNLAARTAIRERMAFTNPHLRTASLAAANALGGQDTFLAAHVRLSNGPFRVTRERTVRSIWYRLVACALRSVNTSAGSNAEVHALERLLVPVNAVLPPPREVLVDSVAPARWAISGPVPTHCVGKAHEERELAPLNVPLFIATDVEDAPALAPFRAAFPCTVLLRDLADVPEVHKLNRLVSAEEGVPLAPFLAPLLDAAIAARAWAVVGTEGSTFSTYVVDLLWQREHGRQIVQRG